MKVILFIISLIHSILTTLFGWFSKITNKNVNNSAIWELPVMSDEITPNSNNTYSKWYVCMGIGLSILAYISTFVIAAAKIRWSKPFFKAECHPKWTKVWVFGHSLKAEHRQVFEYKLCHLYSLVFNIHFYSAFS